MVFSEDSWESILCTPLVLSLHPYLSQTDLSLLYSTNRAYRAALQTLSSRRCCSVAADVSLTQLLYVLSLYPKHSEIPASVCLNPSLDVFGYALTPLIPVSDNKRVIAQFAELLVRNGNLKNLQWLHTQLCMPHHPRGKGGGPAHLIDTACIIAARVGNLHILRWARCVSGVFSATLTWKMYSAACLGGSLSVLEWLKSIQYPPLLYFTPHMCTEAAKGGHLHVLQWLRSLSPSTPVDSSLCYFAAKSGHLHVLQWAYQNFPHIFSDSSTTRGAARGGQTHVLQWARALPTPLRWNVATCAEAASAGHLHILQWLRAQTPPTPWSISVFQEAARNGHLHVVKWLSTQTHSVNTTPWSDWATPVCMEAALKGHLHIIQWVQSQYSQESQDLQCSTNLPKSQNALTHTYSTAAARVGHLHILEWSYRDPHTPLPFKVFFEATVRGEWKIIKWCTTRVVSGCLQSVSPLFFKACFFFVKKKLF